MKRVSALLLLAGMAVAPASAGPPYATDDPEPTDQYHYEIYTFGAGVAQRDGSEGETGVDFNYGAAANLQLTAAAPFAFSNPKGGPSASGLGNIELAAKYKFLHQDTFGWDVAFFPRIFLPAGSGRVGDRHGALLLPIWLGRSGQGWSTFGGGGCTINRGGGSKDFCQAGWGATFQVTPKLQLGAELFHQSADAKGGKDSTLANLGAIYDLNERFHLLISAGPGLENASETGRFNWYASLETTF